MTLPKTIRVGALDYAVKVDEDLTDLGGCNVDTLAIYLRAGLPVQKTCEVLIHEVLHACYDGASLAKAGKLTEEQVVNGLGYQLVQVMRDNPALLGFVGEVFGHRQPGLTGEEIKQALQPKRAA